MSNHDIEGHVPPEAAPDANAQSGAPDSLERQLAKEREARQLIRDRLRHTEALAAESHALRAEMADELERVTADRDRLRAEATIAAAVATPEPTQAAARPPEPAPPAAGAGRPSAADMRERPASAAGTAGAAPAAGSARAAQGPRAARGAEPTLSPTPPTRGRDEHVIGERPLKPPVRRGPWRALAMLGGLAAAVAGLAWLTGTMPSGLGLASLMPSSASAPGTGSMPTASSPALAMDSQPDTPAASVAAASAVPSAGVAATTPAPRGAVPLPPMSPEAQLAAAPAAAWPVPAPASAGVASAVVARPPVQVAARNQSQLQAQGGLDLRLRKALDGEGITSIVEVDPTSGHVLVADPQADHVLRERTDMLIRAVYAGASLPEPQIEHRWMSPMHGERADPLQAQAAAPTVQGKGQARTTTKSRTQAPAPGTTQRDLASTRTPGMVASERVNLAPPGAGGPTRHVESARAGATAADAEELRPVVPSGRVTASCMEDIAAKTSNRRGALSACMKRSCCSSSGNLNSEECRAYQKAYPYTCGAG